MTTPEGVVTVGSAVVGVAEAVGALASESVTKVQNQGKWLARTCGGVSGGAA